MRFCTSVWDMLWGAQFPFIDTETVKWGRTEHGYSAQAIVAPVAPPKAPRRPFEIFQKSYDPDTGVYVYQVNTGYLWPDAVPGTLCTLQPPPLLLADTITLPNFTVLPAGGYFYVWITFCTADSGGGAYYGVAFGETGDEAFLVGGNAGGGQVPFVDPWEVVGVDDKYHILIGMIDTTVQPPVVTQMLDRNLPVAFDARFYAINGGQPVLDYLPDDNDYSPRAPVTLCNAYEATRAYYAGDQVLYSVGDFDYLFGLQPTLLNIGAGPTIGATPDPAMADLANVPWYVLSKSPKQPAFYNGDNLLQKSP